MKACMNKSIVPIGLPSCWTERSGESVGPVRRGPRPQTLSLSSSGITCLCLCRSMFEPQRCPKASGTSVTMEHWQENVWSIRISQRARYVGSSNGSPGTFGSETMGSLCVFSCPRSKAECTVCWQESLIYYMCAGPHTNLAP
jgi:hypothetical protein